MIEFKFSLPKYMADMLFEALDDYKLNLENRESGYAFAANMVGILEQEIEELENLVELIEQGAKEVE
jgi:hypothetical protein